MHSFLNRVVRGASRRNFMVEGLERRRLLSSTLAGSTHDTALAAFSACTCSACRLTGPALEAAMNNAASGPGKDHDASWYRAVATADADGAAGYSVNAAGLPLLASRPDVGAFNIFLDFDGHGSNLPFSLDADTATYNTTEQGHIYDTWRDIISYFSVLNVNVTTIQPPTGGSNPAFAWHLTSNSISGGYAYVGWIGNDAPHGFNESGDAVGRHSGIAHEIGHLLGLSHQSEYDKLGNKTSEYSDGFSNLDRPIMGVDFAENVRRWFYGRDSDNPLDIVDELVVMGNKVAGVVGGDGFLPDAVLGTIAGATNIPAAGMLASVLERLGDIDVFRFTSSGGTYQIDATPTFESAVAPKIELLDASGNILASRDDADQRARNNNDQEFSLDLPAGTYYVRVSSSGDYGELGEYLVTAAPLPNAWASTDIGNNFRGGTAAYSPTLNTLTQLGGGTDIWSTADSFRFTYVPLSGDGSITAYIDSLDNTGDHAKAGVMIRQALTTNSVHAYMGIKPAGTLDPISRTATGASAGQPVATPGTPGRWVRLTRAGNVFTFSHSLDNITWTNLGTQTISMSGTVYMGFATCAFNARKPAYSTFSNVVVSGALGPTAPSYNALPAPSNFNAVPTSAATTDVVLNWDDIAGETGYAIERSPDGVNFTQIVSLGANVTTYTNTSMYGSMRYYYRIVSLSGSTRSVPSASISVVNKPAAPAGGISGYSFAAISLSETRILLNWTDVQGETGYSVERSSNGGSSYTLIGTLAQNVTAFNDAGLSSGTTYVYRITPLTTVGNGVAPSLSISASTRLPAVPGLVFTSKQSTSMELAWTDLAVETGYRVDRSLDGTTWSSVATLAANATSWLDSAVSAVNEYYYRVVGTTSLTESLYNTIFSASPASTPLPAGWSNVDVGAVGGSGTTSVSAGTWTMLASGNDIWNTGDQFQFASRDIAGDGEIIARVASLENTDANAKAGLMFRESLATGSRFVMLAFNANGSLELLSRASTGASATLTTSTTVATPIWLKLNRTGNVFTASYSSNGTTWTVLGTRTLAMNAALEQGLAVTSHNNSRLARATFDNVTATGSVANAAPQIVNPATAAPSTVVTKTTNVSVLGTDDAGEANLTYTWATFSKPAGAADVQFSLNASNGAKNSVATFSAAGTYTLRVTVRDAQGLSVTSNVNVTVQSTVSSIDFESLPTGAVSPNSITQLNAVARDQFQNVMTINMNWTVDGGSITRTGHWTTPAEAGVYTITVSAGGVYTQAILSVMLVATATNYAFNTPALQFTLNGDLGSSFTAEDVVITRIFDNVVISPTLYSTTFDGLTGVATILFTGFSPAVLPNGSYHARLKAGSVEDVSLVALTSDVDVEFYTLAGDADRDRVVDFNDLLTLARAYNSTNRSFSDGNFDYSADGLVGFNDLLLLAKNYNTGLALTSLVSPQKPGTAKSRVASTVLS